MADNSKFFNKNHFALRFVGWQFQQPPTQINIICTKCLLPMTSLNAWDIFHWAANHECPCTVLDPVTIEPTDMKVLAVKFGFESPQEGV